jgi:hypothetical protein
MRRRRQICRLAAKNEERQPADGGWRGERLGGVLSERRGGLWVRSISGTSGKQALNKKNGHFRDTRRLRSGQLKTNNKEEEFGNECRAAEKVKVHNSLEMAG